MPSTKAPAQKNAALDPRTTAYWDDAIRLSLHSQWAECFNRAVSQNSDGTEWKTASQRFDDFKAIEIHHFGNCGFPATTIDRLLTICGVIELKLGPIATLQDRVAADQTQPKVEAYDFLPLLRNLWSAMTFLDGNVVQPKLPSGEPTAHQAIGEFQKVANWCREQLAKDNPSGNSLSDDQVRRLDEQTIQLTELIRSAVPGELAGKPKAEHLQDTYLNEAFVPVKDVWEDRFDNYGAFKRWLDDISEETIRRRKPSSQRLEIHLFDWTKYWKNRDSENSEALDREDVQEMIADIEAKKAEEARKKRRK